MHAPTGAGLLLPAKKPHFSFFLSHQRAIVGHHHRQGVDDGIGIAGRAGNAGGIKITFNGKDMGTLGEIGQIADRTFVKEAAAPQAGVNDADGHAGQAAGGQAGAAEQSYYQESYSEPAPAEPAAPAAPAEAVQAEAPAAEPPAPAPAAEQGQPAAAAQ